MSRAIRMLAELAARIGRWRDAENLLRRAIELAPGFTAARANLALVLGPDWAGQPKRWSCSTTSSRRSPTDLGHWNLKAATLGRLGDFDEAIALYESVLAAAPDQPRVWMSYGHMLKTVGRQAEGHRRLPQGDRAEADAGRGLVEPGEPQDGQVRRCGHCRDGRRLRPQPR